MKTVVPTLACLLPVLVLRHPARINAHDWYPEECCNDMDCAPVESVQKVVPPGGGAPYLIVTSKKGKVTIRPNFPVRDSKDSRMHVCLGHYEREDSEPICFFVPPGM